MPHPLTYRQVADTGRAQATVTLWPGEVTLEIPYAPHGTRRRRGTERRRAYVIATQTVTLFSGGGVLMLVPGKFSRAQTLLAVAMVQGKRCIRAWCGQKNVCSSVPEYATGSESGRVPLGRIGSPESIADGGCWLRADAARSINGKTIIVNGSAHCGESHRFVMCTAWAKGGDTMHRLRVIFPSARAVYPDKEVALRTATLRTCCGPQTHLEFGYPHRGDDVQTGSDVGGFPQGDPVFRHGRPASRG